MGVVGGALRRAVRGMQPLVPGGSSGVTILAYHLIGAGTRTMVDLPPEAFRDQLHELRAIADLRSLPEALDLLAGAVRLPKPVVVITFDDGFDNFRTTAWPFLHALRIPCTLYVPVGFVEGTMPPPLRGAHGLKPLEWRALSDLATDPLLTVGSHSWSHADLRRLSVGDLRRDLRQARDRLQERTGTRVEHFCYPQAKRSRIADREVRAVYGSAVIAGGWRNNPARFDPYSLGRVPVRTDMPVGLAPVLRSAVWLEEWAASFARAVV